MYIVQCNVEGVAMLLAIRVVRINERENLGRQNRKEMSARQ